MLARARLLPFACASWFAMSASAGQDDVLDRTMAACVSTGDGQCLLRLAAFEDAAALLEASPEGLPEAAVLRRALGQADRAYADALTFAHDSHGALALQAVAVAVFDLIENLDHAGEDARTVDFLRRYLHDFKDRAPSDLVLVAHARLGALLAKKSCPVATFHGACVEMVREMRRCPDLGEGPFKPLPISSRTTPPRTTYSVDLARPHRRDPSLLREAMEHLKAVLDSRRYARAEQEAMASPVRQRALANAKAQAILDLATPVLDEFMATSGVPEDLDFSQPTQFDSPCEAQRKARTLEWSSRRFRRWLRAKGALARKLLRGAHQAIEVAGPESAVTATARLAMVERFTWQALVSGDTQMLECPFDGFREPTTLGTVFEKNEQAASQGCLRLANTFGIDNRWTQYCRWAASQYESGRRDLIREIFPSEIVTAHVRDELESDRYQPVVVEPQARPRARPPRFACKKTKTPDGVLKMEEDFDLAALFRSRSPFPDTYPAELAARFPP